MQIPGWKCCCPIAVTVFRLQSWDIRQSRVQWDGSRDQMSFIFVAIAWITKGMKTVMREAYPR